jgi:hypothetical protein
LREAFTVGPIFYVGPIVEVLYAHYGKFLPPIMSTAQRRQREEEEGEGEGEGEGKQEEGQGGKQESARG